MTCRERAQKGENADEFHGETYESFTAIEKEVKVPNLRMRIEELSYAESQESDREI